MPNGKQKHLFITGGTGFIGRPLVSYFLSRGYFVSCLTRQPDQRSSHPRLRYVQGDLNNSVVCKVDQPPKLYDAFLHFGALTARKNGRAAYSCNATGTQNLINTFSQQLKNTPFIYASSIAVMDDGSFPNTPKKETQEAKAISLYGQSKLSGEHILLKASRQFQFHPALLRLTTVYGSGDVRGGISLLIKFIKNYPLPFLVTPPSQFNFLYVHDIPVICEKIIEKPLTRSKIYILAEKKSHSLAECCQFISQTFHKKLRCVTLPKGFWNTLCRFSAGLGFNKLFSFQIRCITDNVTWCDSSEITRDYQLEWTSLENGLTHTLKD